MKSGPVLSLSYVVRVDNFSEKFGSFFRVGVRLCASIWHQFLAHKCLQQASSLAFNTLLCFVPLSAVALFFLKTFGVVEDGNSPLIAMLRDNFLPRYSAEEIVSELSEFANRNLGGLSVGGFLLFLVMSTMLFMSVEQHFNDIWGTRRRLPVVQAFQKYTVFYTLLSVGPLLIWLFFSTGRNWVFVHVFPWVLIYCLFFLMYLAMPNTAVRWYAALSGTLVAGTFFQVAKLAFGRYLEAVWQNYSDIYGALATLVIFAIWTYMVWVVILLGAEVSHSVQHFGRSVRRGEEMGGYLDVSGVIGLFLIVADRFARGGGACSVAEVAAQARVSEAVVYTSFERFRAAGLLYAVEGDTDGYLPGRDLADITLAAVVGSVAGAVNFAENVLGESGVAVLERLGEYQATCLEGVTVAAVLEV